MKRCTIGLMIGLAVMLVGRANAEDEVRTSVVKIHATKRLPNPFRPWTKQTPKSVSGSGVVIDGKRILTNAHVVNYAHQLYVQGYQSADKVEATVEAIAPGIDLAIVRVKDEAFFKERKPLPLTAALPKIKDTVNAYGYPTGGEEMSVTEGIVSRIEMSRYYHNTVGLRIQVDAALNPGNSGGPAVSKGKVVGLVFSGIRTAENIGYLIPAAEIQTFLADIKDGKYEGKPNIHDGMQSLENEALREKLGLDRETTGVMVTQPAERNDDYPLREWDVITHIGEHQIDNEGHVRVQDDLRLSFRYYLQKLAKDGKVELTIRRDGKSMKVQVPVPVERDVLITSLKTSYPRYFIYGPLVFTAATHELIDSTGAQFQWALARIDSPLIARLSDQVTFKGEELVVVSSPMFSHKIIKGYSNAFMSVLQTVNGTKVKNLRHLVELLRDVKDDFVVFKFADQRMQTVVFRRKDVAGATEEILTDNGIRKQYSDDLRDVWEKK